MRGLKTARLVAAAQIALADFVADVANIAEPVAIGALREVAPEMGAEAAKDQAEIVVRIELLVEAANDEEAAPDSDFFLQSREVGGDAGEREFVAFDRLCVGLAPLETANVGVDLVDRRRGKLENPILRAG